MNALFLLALLLAVSCWAREMLLNDVQTKGSHMSFHVAPSPTIPFFNWTHDAIASQLEEQGVHAIELRFRVVGGDFPVALTPAIDGFTNCPNISRCLQSAFKWTSSNSGHFPLFIIIDAAEDSSSLSKWTWDVLDNAITSIWPRYIIVKPSDVQGEFGNVRDSVEERGWPTLRSTLGKVVVLLRVNASSYAADPEALACRVGFPIFSLDAVGAENAVVFEQTTPLLQMSAMQEAAERGFLVITRADSTFVDALTEPFDASQWFDVANTNNDGLVSNEELARLFGPGMEDLFDSDADRSALLSAVDGAVYSCAGAKADGVTSSQFGCFMEAISAKLPAAEGLVAVRARLASAQKSGAHIILTNYPTAPFKGAPASQFWFLDNFETSCNPITTCSCYLSDFIAVTKCSSAPPRVISGSPAMLAFLALAVLAANQI